MCAGNSNQGPTQRFSGQVEAHGRPIWALSPELPAAAPAPRGRLFPLIRPTCRAAPLPPAPMAPSMRYLRRPRRGSTAGGGGERESTQLPRAHCSTNPDRSPRGSPHRCVTLVTRPGAPGPVSNASSRRHALSPPSATTCTLPSSRLVADPDRPSSSARDRTHHLNPTPWTRPSTQAVSRAASPSPSSTTRSAVTSGHDVAAAGIAGS